MKVVSVVGTRPNFMKLAPLARALKNTKHTHVILHTGQHYDKSMSGSFFSGLDIPEPDYNLDTGSGCLTDRLADMIVLIMDVLCSELPDLVLVYGDCNSTLAGALAAVQNKFPVMHIEGGIRNNSLLVPETLNRLIVDRISCLNLCACQHDLDNILRDNMNGVLVGDLMMDQFLLDDTGWSESGYALLTLHRPSNVDNEHRFKRILSEIGKSGKRILWPTHPRVSSKYGNLPLPENIDVILPQPYNDMMSLVKGSDIVITDSGGLQKEAYWAHKPCIVILDDATWPQIRETDNQSFIDDSNIQYLPELINNFKGSNNHPNIFGDGNAAARIVEVIDNYDLSTAFNYKT